MPSHVHTPPQCGFWTGHDPACFNQEFGAEVDCILIEVGKNKGSYVCIHKRAPFTDGGRSGFESALVSSSSPHVDECQKLEGVGLSEYTEIRATLTEGVQRK